MVDASLQMADAMRHALCLKFPPRVSKLDVVLKATVQAVASAGGNIVEMRKLRRQKLRVASSMVSDLNRELQALVPEFARPIAGHVNFALVEVLVRAVGWRPLDSGSQPNYRLRAYWYGAVHRVPPAGRRAGAGRYV